MCLKCRMDCKWHINNLCISLIFWRVVEIFTYMIFVLSTYFWSSSKRSFLFSCFLHSRFWFHVGKNLISNTLQQLLKVFMYSICLSVHALFLTNVLQVTWYTLFRFTVECVELKMVYIGLMFHKSNSFIETHKRIMINWA